MFDRALWAKLVLLVMLATSSVSCGRPTNNRVDIEPQVDEAPTGIIETYSPVKEEEAAASPHITKPKTPLVSKS